MICQNAGSLIAQDNDGDIPKVALSDVEEQAIVDARFQLADALNALGLMPHFENLSGKQIDVITKACVIGFQASVHRQLSGGKVPFFGTQPSEGK